ncbi:MULTISPECIES: hypothetical protein [Kocuria]|jgi:hypothetical protein|uniref:hypothetical protein n=1 Tax=Kocuria TaxID=57493 RepID=UPI002040D2D5|nr:MULTISPECIES: hypothetical protein [Kocuria]MCM3689314.1 hypothetical protein [Kocuria rosea]HST72407.1 hypothetical protein [Kocuria rosea]
MDLSATPHDPSALPEEPGAAPPTVVDLTTGSARITPVVVDGEERYELALPAEPLAEDDVESLAVALHVAQAGGAVLVDVDEYVEATAAPQPESGHDS